MSAEASTKTAAAPEPAPGGKAAPLAAAPPPPQSQPASVEVPAPTFDAKLGETDALSNIRHSLRTPLNQIIGYAEMLTEEVEEEKLDDYLADLKKIHTAGGQLLALINDALAPWKLETGKIDLDTMRLEMRTPLNLIIGYSELCQEVAQEEAHAQLVPDFQKITAAAKNLMALFDSSSFPTRLEIGIKASKPGVSAIATLGGTRSTGEEAGEAGSRHGELLIIDDNEMNRDMLCRRLERQGYSITEAENGRQGLDLLRNKKFDLVLLDVVMPEMNGFETLERIKADKGLRHIPVIMLSAMDELDTAVKCIEIGAEDYIPKPFNPVLLNARMTASLEKKRLRDQEQAYVETLQIEREKSERLLLNILPKSVADRMKQGETTIADHFSNATVLFADIVNFTQLVTQVSPAQVVDFLNEVFSGFDWLAELHGLEKIKTIGDAYMVVGGVPSPQPNHASAVAEMAVEMQRTVKRLTLGKGITAKMRVGISSGPVTAGVIGRKKFIYDLWGDTVNTASHIESFCDPDRIQVSQSTHDLLRDRYVFEKGSKVVVPGRGEVGAYYLIGRGSRSAP